MARLHLSAVLEVMVQCVLGQVSSFGSIGKHVDRRSAGFHVLIPVYSGLGRSGTVVMGRERG